MKTINPLETNLIVNNQNRFYHNLKVNLPTTNSLVKKAFDWFDIIDGGIQIKSSNMINLFDICLFF